MHTVFSFLYQFATGGILGEITDFRTIIGNTQNRPRAFCSGKKAGKCSQTDTQ